MNGRYVNSRVSKPFATFISDLKDAQVQVHFIDPMPPAQIQLGFTCGYYAASTVTQFWNKTNPNHPAYYARKSDSKKANPGNTHHTSLRAIGKQEGLNEVGGIFNVEHFKLILARTEYRCVCPSFETQEDFNFLLQRSLQRKQPVIVPVDMNFGISIFHKGTRAHYVTVFGCFKSNDKIFYIYTTYNSVYTVVEDLLFGSCHQLIEKASATFYKEGKEWNKLEDSCTDISNKRTHFLLTQNLKDMRDKLIMIYPASEPQSGLDVIMDCNELSRKNPAPSLLLFSHAQTQEPNPASIAEQSVPIAPSP